MTKDNNNIMMITLTNGMEIIFQVVDVDNTEWYTIQNPVAILRDEENEDRINMRPLFQYGRRDSDIKIHTRKIDVLYTPTTGLTDEYLTVFINATEETPKPKAKAKAKETVKV